MRRLQVARLYGGSVHTREIRQVIQCSDCRIRERAQTYGQQGLAGLKSHWQGENALKQRLHQYQPDQVLSAEVRVSQGQFWTVSDLQLVVKAWYAMEYRTLDSYRSLLHECGLSYQPTERIFRSQPDAQTVADFQAQLEKK